MTLSIIFLQSPGAGAMIAQFLPIAAIVLIFYFLVIAPASRQRKKTEAMLAALKKGDRVLTSGGVYGQVQSVDQDVVWLKIADNVKIKIAKSAVTTLVDASGGSD
ncbi:MAG TPA: preprotein translocase subunit YajC [Thermoanaerobaculia bacterium]|nr:preprotein translocase subunit YajC [Thermoanaerobaculia bacterium]